MLVKFAYVALLAAVCLVAQSHGAALRSDTAASQAIVQKLQPLVLKTTTPVSSATTEQEEEAETTTLPINEKDLGKAASRDEDASVTLVVEHASVDPAPTEEGDQPLVLAVATSRDIDATLQLVPANGVPLQTVEEVPFAGFEVVFVQTEEGTEEGRLESKETAGKAAKLLLSTAKVHEKPPNETEQNIAEPEEQATTIDTTTEQASEATTMKVEPMNKGEKQEKRKKAQKSKETSAESEENKDSDESNESDETKKGKQTTTTTTTTARTTTEGTTASNDENSDKSATDMLKAEEEVALELLNAPHNNNIASAVLVETESDYVLLDVEDAEALEHGSFTHIDSAVHLQPIVQSVEIVPSSLDDELIVSYAHSW